MVRNRVKTGSVILLGFVSTTVAGCSEEDALPAPVNHAPVITQVAVSPEAIQAGGHVLVSVVASDQDGDTLSYFYQGPGTLVPEGPTAVWTPPAGVGTYGVTVAASDPGGMFSPPVTGHVTVLAAQQTGFRGSGSLGEPATGDLSNAKVAYYANLHDWAYENPVGSAVVEGSGATVTFNFVDVDPGTYFLDIWKDSNANGTIDDSDFFGWYGHGTFPNGGLDSFDVVQDQMRDLGVITVYFIQ